MIVSSVEKVTPWVAKKTFGDFRGAQEAIGLEIDGEIVAGVVYEGWNGASFTVHTAIEKMTPAYLAAIFHYPFIHCGVKKLIAPVSEKNEDSINLVTKMGFKPEATLSGAHPDGDLLLYTLERKDCKYIEERYGKKCRVATSGA